MRDLKEVIDLAIDDTAPIDLGEDANASLAAPLDADVGGNVLSEASRADALAEHVTASDQDVNADAIADSSQESTLDQVAGADNLGTTSDPMPDATTTPTVAGGVLDGGLLNVDVNLDGDVGIAAPINGAVAANANV